MTVQASISVDVSDWRPANIHTNREVVFAVGDVHGCAAQLSALLDACGQLHDPRTRRTRLVFLGDVINRGPATIQALQRWADESPIPGVSHVDRLMGNHEQLLLLAIRGGDPARVAYGIVHKLGLDHFLHELRLANGTPNAELTRDLLRDGIGSRAMRRLDHELKPSIRVGNLLFVHAGVDPNAAPDEFLSLPAEILPSGDNHWAWIEERFLTWRCGFNGTVVVHGHTPPRKHRELTGQTDPHLLVLDRLGLDGGSAITGIVAAAQIEDGRYRIIRAVESDTDRRLGPTLV